MGVVILVLDFFGIMLLWIYNDSCEIDLIYNQPLVICNILFVKDIINNCIHTRSQTSKGTFLAGDLDASLSVKNIQNKAYGLFETLKLHFRTFT